LRLRFSGSVRHDVVPKLPYNAEASGRDRSGRLSVLLNDDSFRKVAIMFSAFKRFSNLLLAMVLIVGLAACTTTDTGSKAVIEDSSIETPAPTGQEAGDVAEVVDESAETEMAPDASTTPSPDESPAMEESIPADEAMESDVSGPTTGAAEQAETVEPVEEFPIQRYEIDEPREVATESESDAEIERLRKELAATESELEQIRAEEEQRKYAPSESMTSTESSGDDSALAPSQQQPMSTAQAPATQAPMEAIEPKSRADISGLPGRPTENSVYFGYDQAELDSQYETVLFAHAEFLKANPKLKIEIQGNCDERGSREYNIALGQRRAFTVKRALELLGVEGYRIDTVSFGSEKPVAFGHDETSWRLNRRADIVYGY